MTKVQVERISPPAFLLSCLSDPDVPVNPTQGTVAAYITDLYEAYSDCRGKVEAMRRLYGDGV